MGEGGIRIWTTVQLRPECLLIATILPGFSTRRAESPPALRAENRPGGRGIPVQNLFSHRWRQDQAPEAYSLFDKQNTGKGVILF